MKGRKEKGYHRKPAHAKEKDSSKVKASHVSSSSSTNEISLEA